MVVMLAVELAVCSACFLLLVVRRVFRSSEDDDEEDDDDWFDDDPDDEPVRTPMRRREPVTRSLPRKEPSVSGPAKAAGPSGAPSQSQAEALPRRSTRAERDHHPAGPAWQAGGPPRARQAFT
ncbi:MAG: hypothetical protein CM15mP128_2710 [Methanobacteriota archaeon]|nr:MAG: hypothetical protein CM15mP128_2710 [Euryarchaeota archaeon]